MRNGFTERGTYLAGRSALADGPSPVIVRIEPGVRHSIVVPTAAGFFAPRVCAGRARDVRH